LAGYRFTWEDSRFIHFNRVSFGHVLLESEKNSSGIEIDSLSMKLGIFPALGGNLLVRKLACHNISVLVDLNKSLRDTLPYEGPIRTVPVANYSLTVNRIVHRLFMAVPRRLEMDTV